jgi:adenosine deaminase/aminodeoxyfutalosine deaminase
MDPRSLPKTELHLHLEGSISPETLVELSPCRSLDEARRSYDFTDFAGFMRAYKHTHLRLNGPADFALITRRLLADLSTQGVVRAEINVSVGVMLWRGFDVDACFSAIAEAAADNPFPVRFIFDAVRQFSLDEAWQVARAAARHQHQGVVGFGIGGDEKAGPARNFKEIFAWARAEGLHLVPHAGEIDGPESVWQALEVGAERIGHGIRSIDDPALVRHLAHHHIPLEISLTSNVRTGAVASLAEHPLRKLFDAGVPVVLNTDDPAMFGATLCGEYALAQSAFGFSDQELAQLAADSLRYAFA